MSAVWPSVISRATEGLTTDGNATVMGGVMMAWLLGAGLGAMSMSWLFGARVQQGFTVLIVVWAVAYGLSIVAMKGTAVSRASRKQVVLGNVLQDVSDVKRLFPGVFVQMFAIGILLPVLVLYAHLVLHLDGRMYSYMLLTGGATAVFLQIPVGKLVDRFGYRPFLTSGFLLAAVSLPMICFFREISGVFLSVGLFGTAYAFILPSWNSVVANCVQPGRRAVMFGVFMTVEGLGMAVGPVVGTLLWNVLGPRGPFELASIILFIMGVVYGMMRLERLFVQDKGAEQS